MNFRYKLKTASPVFDGEAAYFFAVQGPFIPLQTVRLPSSVSFGEVDGRKVYDQGLQRIFEEYESIPMLLQNLIFVDLSDFVLKASRYVPNPIEFVNYNPDTERIFLLYLEPLN